MLTCCVVSMFGVLCDFVGAVCGGLVQVCLSVTNGVVGGLFSVLL